jgi:Tfp pilus assembly protein PilV
MPDMNSLTVILLAEACVILLIALIAVLSMQIRSKSKQRQAVKQLVSQIKTQSKARSEETESFLHEVYDLSDKELAVAVAAIDKQEKHFFQKLIDTLNFSDTSQITTLDSTVVKLIDTYKSLRPKQVEASAKVGADNNTDDLNTLRAENATLAEELKITRETMASVISEFGSMFGGGKNKKLESIDLANKVAISSRPSEGDNTVGQVSKKKISEVGIDSK